jgi:predicted dehydrogenase
MKALFIGLGSVGQRHLTNFKKVMDDNTQILAYRETNHNTLIVDGAACESDSLAEYYGFKQFSSLDDALSEQPDVVFIANPSSRHIEAALKAAKCGCNLFIEKPLSHNLDGIELLKEQVENRNLIVMVGYQTRFHPCYNLVRSILSEGEYGGVISASFEWGTYLPNHHPYEDYRKGYAAVKELGGGVVLSLIHEIDIIYSFWGQPKGLWAIGGKLSTLEMDIEDTISVLMGFQRNKVIFPVSLFLSYAQTKEVRQFRIQMDRATVFCDLLQNTVSVFDEKGRLAKQDSFPELKRNNLFLDEMREFISSVKQKRKPLVSLDDGIESLKLAMRIKEQIVA